MTATEAAAPRQCEGADCTNDAGTLQCPTCQKQGKDSYFCSQDCFKRNWVRNTFGRGLSYVANNTQATHKASHKKQSSIIRNIIPPKVVSEPDPVTGHYNPYPTYSYTGSIRPVYPLSEKRTIPDHIPKPDYAKDGIPRSEQMFVGKNKITILDKAQQDGMRKVCRLAREVLDLAAREAKPGVTTDHIDEVVHKACVERNVSTHRYSTIGPH